MLAGTEDSTIKDIVVGILAFLIMMLIIGGMFALMVEADKNSKKGKWIILFKTEKYEVLFLWLQPFCSCEYNDSYKTFLMKWQGLIRYH